MLYSLLFIVSLIVCWQLRHISRIGELALKNPSGTALMEARRREKAAEGKKTAPPRQIFVPLNKISGKLQKAVLVAEDMDFYEHEGLDYDELAEAVKENWRKKRWVRGASTISQQLAKNLFLSSSRSLLRKISELFYVRVMERELSKQRILELYLNYVEWGDNIYGCEAAAAYYFKSSCAALSTEQAVRLASIIINPRRYHPFDGSRRINCRQKMLARRLLRAGFINSGEFAALPFRCEKKARR